MIVYDIALKLIGFLDFHLQVLKIKTKLKKLIKTQIFMTDLIKNKWKN